MAIMDCLLLLQCEFQFKGYIQKDCLIHLRTILFSYVYKKCYNTHRSHRHKLMHIDRRTNTVKKCTNAGIADITSLPVAVQSNGGTITVTGADDGTIVEVYTMAGTKLGKAKTSFNTATIHTNMQQGNVVIVKVGGKAIKVAL